MVRQAHPTPDPGFQFQRERFEVITNGRPVRVRPIDDLVGEFLTDFYLEALLLSARVQWLLGNTRAKEDARNLVQQSAQIGALWMQKREERLLAKMGKRCEQ